MFKKNFPPIETVLDMEPSELAPFVLKDLNEISQTNQINRYNYTLSTSSDIQDYARKHVKDFQKRLMEAYIWLEREMFIAPEPDSQGEWRFITRSGEKVLQNEDFTAYKQGLLLPSENLHPILIRKVKPLFLRGDYDTSVFQAFKAVEIQVRKVGGYTKGDYGVDLMRTAFHPQTGKLTNTHSLNSEKQAMSDLFAGAIGLFKNPVSHRDIEIMSSEEAVDYIMVANCLLKMVSE
ncbi:TIGR02391 family protein [Patescibacteria group bacterium]|nr:TIGR02391 family protein [Patescibacteria group bacterium]MBU4578666.1 TIGR02391 family protein [Patescibacteria group bacterium]MCG2701800.1 TIGR02391 family protein [Candidatus Parcubacteria bacterium]